MANTIPAAGIPAATTYPRWRATGGGGWAAPTDGRTLERERLEIRARVTDATGQLLRCFPRWSRALEHGIETELIPGISSALAVPGLAGIPLTHRRISRSFAVITGHCRPDAPAEWQKYASIDTLVILMGVKNRIAIASGLIRGGRSPEDPVAFVQRGTTASEAILECTLEDVARGCTHPQSPAILVVGEVVRLRHRLTSPTLPGRASDSES